MTGSATASNILFTELQETTAQYLELPLKPILGVHGFGAGIGITIALQNIIAGGITVGLAGQEGQVLRRTLPICLLYAALGGLNGESIN
jgi:lactate permease